MSGGPRCPTCDGELYKRHCKYVCPAHGVVMDCADTFWNR
ncbi:HVO_2523 family zinc finger protein [Salinirubellus salinus]|nr:HVO_2523 family zinc finger protein [Salinirubellus salinus]